ncbi:MAG TPA: DUF1801 domain-containing protein [Candidatus Angelobacter sp.]|jgi:uncharacterized protein YdhG (YjbR/CyaY superfamily)
MKRPAKRTAAQGRHGRKKKTTSKTATGKTAARPAASNRRAAKTKASPKTTAPLTVAAYLAAVPGPARSVLNQIREAIRSVVPPEATEIISYKIPAFKHKKVLVWYAAFSGHCSLFPTAAVIEEFKDELKGFSTSKGTVHFPLDKPMPVDLIQKMVKERLGRSG